MPVLARLSGRLASRVVLHSDLRAWVRAPRVVAKLVANDAGHNPDSVLVAGKLCETELLGKIVVVRLDVVVAGFVAARSGHVSCQEPLDRSSSDLAYPGRQAQYCLLTKEAQGAVMSQLLGEATHCLHVAGLLGVIPDCGPGAAATRTLIAARRVMRMDLYILTVLRTREDRGFFWGQEVLRCWL